MRQSAISTFSKCPYNYKLEYMDELDTYPTGDAQNPLIIGTALHYGCETGDVKKALDLYFNEYKVITDLQINEAIKLETQIPKVLDILADFDYIKYENEVSFDVDGFTGTADLIAHNEDGTVDLFDFKYSNNVDYYMESQQLHIYKYFLEKIGYKVNRMAFIFIPKTLIRQKKTETIGTFRMRLKKTLTDMSPTVEWLEYDPQKVADAFQTVIKIYNTDTFEPTPNRLCDWCKFKGYCQKGEDYMIIPKNERRQPTINRNPDMWIYGASYVGKTTFVDQLNDTLMLNTDGNVDAITSPVIRIKDEFIPEGRKYKKVWAWENFKGVISQLEEDPTDFKNIALDLVEDLYEHCRLYMYDKNGWEHEQDGGYGKGYDIIRTEFLSTMKRLKNIGYRIILISKLMTGEVTRGANKQTTYAPNLKAQFAEVIAGIVDMTVLVEADKEGNRFMKFKSSPYVFGGSRFNFGVDKIELSVAALDEAILNAGINANYDQERAAAVAKAEAEVCPSVTPGETEEQPKKRRTRKKVEEVVEAEVLEPTEQPVSNENAADVEVKEEPQEEPQEEKPRRRRRSADK